MTEEEALTFKLPFGKYNGRSIKSVLQVDNDYVFWLYRQDIKNSKLRDALEVAINYFNDSEDFLYD